MRDCKHFSQMVSGFCFLALLSVTAWGQASYTSQVRGVVTDKSGAVVQNATVTITNNGTNIATAARTDEHGLYTITGLRPGSYSVKVEAQGFEVAERKDLVLQVNQQTTVDFTLRPPGIHETVEVTPRLHCSTPKAPPSVPMSAMSTSATSHCINAACLDWCFWLAE